jgi:hypothetical protein
MHFPGRVFGLAAGNPSATLTMQNVLKASEVRTRPLLHSASRERALPDLHACTDENHARAKGARTHFDDEVT